MFRDAFRRRQLPSDATVDTGGAENRGCGGILRTFRCFGGWVRYNLACSFLASSLEARLMYRPMKHVSLAFALLTALVAALATPALAAKPKAEGKTPSKFIRLTRDAKDTPISMETAVVRYKANDDAKQDLIIALIGAVHIGEKSYYEALNKEFENYDVVLYELVAPEGTRVPKGGGKGSSHPVGMMQDGMKDMLELEHQLQHVDYQKENFVHADMSPEAFSKSMSDRGESVWTMMFRAMGQQLAQQNRKPARGNEADMLLALFDKNRALSLKRLMAEQFEERVRRPERIDHYHGAQQGRAQSPGRASRRRQKEDCRLLRRRPHARYGRADDQGPGPAPRRRELDLRLGSPQQGSARSRGQAPQGRKGRRRRQG